MLFEIIKKKKAYTRPFITTYGTEGYIWLKVYVESHDPFPFGSKNRTEEWNQYKE